MIAAALLSAFVASSYAQASPDWRDQVIYFVMTDRFSDGNPRNDDQGHGEFDPKDPNFYSGGDLAGIGQKLDYIQGLGATAVWLTPPVANVWYDPSLKMAGYHGYWAENFKAVDAHLGTLDDYRGLSRRLHGRAMYLIQDVVVNHTGDFFYYDGHYDPAHVERHFKLKQGVYPPRPSQYPFSLDDATNEVQRRTAIYHWTPDITDFNDPAQRYAYQMSGLDDLNTENPVVRDALRDSYDFWISSAGVDGFRFDTVPYVEHAFYRDFLFSASTTAPGIQNFAAALGKKGFLTFGEVWSNGEPFSDREERELATYLGTPENPEMKAVINFPLALDLRAVFAKGAPAAQLAYRLDGLNRHFRGGEAAVNLVENQDMARFLTEGPQAGLEQALMAVFTIPGIPCVYAGTEQGFHETRAAMFAGGWGSGGRDHFDRTSPLYRLIANLSRIRRDHTEFRRGTLHALFGERAGPGAVAYRLDGSRRALVIFNSADEPALLASLDTGLPDGTPLTPLLTRAMKADRLRVGAAGRLSLRLPARAALVLEAGEKVEPVAKTRASATISGFPADSDLSGPAAVGGKARGARFVDLVIDGRLAHSIRSKVGADGSWGASVEPASLADGPHVLAALAQDGDSFAVSETKPFSVSVPWILVKTVDAPVGDDQGPSGTYSYPRSPGFAGRADIERLALYQRGAAVKLAITMAKGLSTAWNPPFGFDHVCFDIYISLPNADGGAVDLPRLNARLPQGTWNYAAFLGGWKAALYSAKGATRSSFGEQLQPPPRVFADKTARTITAMFDPDAFRGSLTGARFYVTTWDYDGVEGALRPLGTAAGDYSFGGGAADGPRIMDAASLAP